LLAEWRRGETSTTATSKVKGGRIWQLGLAAAGCPHQAGGTGQPNSYGSWIPNKGIYVIRSMKSSPFNS